MQSDFSITNLNTLLDSNSIYSEEQIKQILFSFHSPINGDVEHFLHSNSIFFTRKKQSVTYLVWQENLVAGYFTLAVKPVKFNCERLSKTSQKVIERVSQLNEVTGEYSASGYLIAQIGKNFDIPPKKQISGALLLNLAMDAIKKAQYIVGGTIVFLECENRPALLKFYENQGFHPFSTRRTIVEGILLNQMYRLI